MKVMETTVNGIEHTIRRTALAAALVLVAILAWTTLASPSSTGAETALDPAEEEFMTLINDYRAQHGLEPLSIDPNLQAAAEWMSQDMGENAYFSHTDSLGRSPWERMDDFGYDFNTWKGENLAAGYSTAEAVFEGWKNSSGHNSNMLGENYRVMGIAFVHVEGSPFGYYWSNDFGGYEQPGPAESTAMPTPSPTPTPAPTPTPEPTPIPTATPSPTPTPSPTASPTQSPTPTPGPSPSPTPDPDLPPDDDGDGFSNDSERHVGTDPVKACGGSGDTSKPGSPSTTWPADLVTTTGEGEIRLNDLGSFVSPIRRINTSPGHPDFDQRWDIVPGNGGLSETINIMDMGALIALKAPVLNNVSAFNGPTCQ